MPVRRHAEALAVNARADDRIGAKVGHSDGDCLTVSDLLPANVYGTLFHRTSLSMKRRPERRS